MIFNSDDDNSTCDNNKKATAANQGQNEYEMDTAYQVQNWGNWLCQRHQVRRGIRIWLYFTLFVALAVFFRLYLKFSLYLKCKAYRLVLTIV